MFINIIKLFFYVSFFNIFLLGFTKIYADSSYQNLKNRLNQITDLYAYIIQKTNSLEKSTEIEVARGELWIKRPNLFHWHLINPEENFLISNGKNVWFYVPRLKQVTIYCLKNKIIDNIFYRLLFNNKSYIWSDYFIKQKDDWFYLKPILGNYDNIKKIGIKINNYGIIKQISIFEKNGQIINFYLSNQNFISNNINKFIFIVSDDIQVDDQRK